MKLTPCIVGATATGKTKVAIELAQKIEQQYAKKVEIISVDSALVYRGMDIGTAKPTIQERHGIVHHLIDIIEPSQVYSVANFVQDSNLLIKQIRQRDAVPLLVGGTMLYFNALLFGIDNIPPVTYSAKQQVLTQVQQLGWQALHAKLTELDELTAKKIAVNDKQRIQRALEVIYTTGKPISFFHSQTNKPTVAKLAHIIFSFEPQDRAWLHQRVAMRFDLMLQQGFLAEVEQLYQCKDLTINSTSMRCVGYRQAWQYLAGQIDFMTFKEQAIAATRQLVKRQLTWLRKLSQRQTIFCDNQQQLLDPIWQRLQLQTDNWL